MAITSKITPFLWFDEEAEEAARLYVSLFPNSELLSVNRLASGPGEGAGLVEMRFTALYGGPMYKLRPAVWFVVACEAQEEIDHYWYGLSDGGEQQQGGWLAYGPVRAVVAGGAGGTGGADGVSGGPGDGGAAGDGGVRDMGYRKAYKLLSRSSFSATIAFTPVYSRGCPLDDALKIRKPT